MPYIKQENRPLMDQIIHLMDGLQVNYNSELMYVVYEYCDKYITPSYNNYKNYIGELNEVCAEIKRRLRPFPNEGSYRHHIVEYDDDSISQSRAFELNRICALMEKNGVKINGDFNYILFKYTRSQWPTNTRDVICSLQETINMIRKNILAPYENSKIQENGDVD